MSAPDRRHFCLCGHLAAQHPRTGPRPCRADSCGCTEYQKTPRDCCARCGHPSSFRTRHLPDGRIQCAALACDCADWDPRPASVLPVPSGSVAQQRGDADAGNRTVTASATTAAGRAVALEFELPVNWDRLRFKALVSGPVEVMVWRAGS